MSAANVLAEALTGFVAWCGEHIRGDEKGEAQLYLDHLFRAFGHAGLKEAGASCEEHVKKDGGSTAFADLVWKPVVLVEMKKRGTDLAKHYRQPAARRPCQARCGRAGRLRLFRQRRPAAATARPQSCGGGESRRWRHGE